MTTSIYRKHPPKPHTETMPKPHVLLLPCPAQGHVIPAMELARRLVKEGVKATFVNTEAIHDMVTKNWLEKDGCDDLIQMVSIPDGLEPSDPDRNGSIKVLVSMQKCAPSKLEQVIETINEQDDNKITCVVFDFWMAWTLGVAKKMGIRTAIFFPASIATLATVMSAQKLIEDGFINSNGIPQNNEMIRLEENMPTAKPKTLLWACIGDSIDIEVHFQINVNCSEAAKSADQFLCNSAVELEPAAFSLFPQLLPVGPLLATNILADQVGHFWQEDLTCLTWLDQQPVCSVIYVAFGSITNFNQTQFEELALGLEISNRPFLWVMRPSKEATTAYPDGYMDRVGSRGRIVNWAPQQKVLAHPSVACFMSHCGWNSTLEGVTNGLPFLCWPYFADQYYNETYICDIWKTGLGFNKDEAGIITREEIKSKIDQLFDDSTFKSKALDIKESVASSVREGGSSHKNLTKFIEWIHAEVTKTSDDYVKNFDSS